MYAKHIFRKNVTLKISGKSYDAVFFLLQYIPLYAKFLKSQWDC